MTNLQIFAKELKAAANNLPKSYNDMTVTELADGYCEALDSQNNILKESYFAGLMLKFWYLIDKLYKENGTALKMNREDFIDWIAGSILQACNKSNRSWQTGKHKAEQVIHTILQTRFKAQAYYESNLQIHKANFGTESLDTPVDDEGETTKSDLIESGDPSPAEYYNSADEIIQRCLDNNRVIEAIVAETISYNDCFKTENKTVKEIKEDGTEYKYTKQTSTFWPFQVVKILSNLPDNYKEYFLHNYSINPEILDTCLAKIKKSNNTKLYSYLDATKEYLRNYI